MEDILLSEVKPWLRNSKFYRNLRDEEDEDTTISIPIDKFLLQPKYNTWKQINKTLQVCNYWDVDFIPVGVVKFIYMRKCSST